MKSLFLLALIVAGCDLDQPQNRPTPITILTKICVEGHVYYEWVHSISPKLYDDGTPVKCSMEIK